MDHDHGWKAKRSCNTVSDTPFHSLCKIECVEEIKCVESEIKFGAKDMELNL